MLILTGSKVDRMDWEEATHRFHELDALLKDCEGMPSDHPLMKEYKALRLLLDPDAH